MLFLSYSRKLELSQLSMAVSYSPVNCMIANENSLNPPEVVSLLRISECFSCMCVWCMCASMFMVCGCVYRCIYCIQVCLSTHTHVETKGQLRVLFFVTFLLSFETRSFTEPIVHPLDELTKELGQCFCLQCLSYRHKPLCLALCVRARL